MLKYKELTDSIRALARKTEILAETYEIKERIDVLTKEAAIDPTLIGTPDFQTRVNIEGDQLMALHREFISLRV